jgi:hypothetical protein
LPAVFPGCGRRLAALARAAAQWHLGRKRLARALAEGGAARSVRWDGAKEQVLDDAEANRLLSRKYRAPWEYPKV